MAGPCRRIFSCKERQYVFLQGWHVRRPALVKNISAKEICKNWSRVMKSLAVRITVRKEAGKCHT